ncbi:MAG: hypothetical protein R6W06_09875 [Prochlorococcaceae cyanobacterium]
MGWDPTVLRKYNTTGHFRLLNQLRGELQAHPIQRRGASELAVPARSGPGSGSASGGTAARGRRSVRTVEIRPQSYGRNRRAVGDGYPPIDLLPAAEESGDAGVNGSFRDRLNAIEMR